MPSAEGANSLGHWSDNGALVVGKLKLVKVVGEKILSVYFFLINAALVITTVAVM